MKINQKVMLNGKVGKVYDMTEDKKTLWVETKEDIFKVSAEDVTEIKNKVLFKKDLRKALSNYTGEKKDIQVLSADHGDEFTVDVFIGEEEEEFNFSLKMEDKEQAEDTRKEIVKYLKGVYRFSNIESEFVNV